MTRSAAAGLGAPALVALVDLALVAPALAAPAKVAPALVGGARRRERHLWGGAVADKPNGSMGVHGRVGWNG